MKTEYRFTDGQFDAPADMQVISNILAQLGIALPEDYVRFLSKHNGGEGFLGEEYFIFWKAEELIPFNREYQVDKYAPGILLFGSSGGGEAYGFDTQDPAMPIVRVPFVGMSRRYAIAVARNFTELLATSLK
jgi:SMI1 / KNR4 family (SUKH-1)